MTRYAFLLKWFWYAMAALPVWLAEELVFSRVLLLGVRPVLLPLTVVAVAVLEGTAAGAGFGLGVGVFWAAALPGTHALLPLGLTLLGLLSGWICQYRLRQNCAGFLSCSVLVLLLLALSRILSAHWGGAALLPLLRIGGGELAVSLLLATPVYLLFRLIYDRVGGTKLM